MKGLKRDAEGLWLVKTEHRAAGKNPDGNDCALVLPLLSLSLSTWLSWSCQSLDPP